MDAVSTQRVQRPTSIFHRSNSSSDISLSQRPNNFIYGARPQIDDELPRSASYTSLSARDPERYTIEDYFTADVAVAPLDIPDSLSRQNSNEDQEGIKHKDEKALHKAAKAQKTKKGKSSMSGWVSRMLGKSEPKELSPLRTSTVTPASPEKIVPIHSPSVTRPRTTESITSVDRKSNTSSSRSPSPIKKMAQDLTDEYSTTASSISSVSPKASLVHFPKEVDKALEKKAAKTLEKSMLERTGPVLMRKLKKADTSLAEDFKRGMKPTSILVVGGPVEAVIRPSAAMLAGKPPHQSFREKVPVLRPSNNSAQKDELWPAFRSLESDHAKFMVKTSALKANVVRSTVLPFLRNHFYLEHPSTKNLCPAHLERRINVLNKWWQSLLHMLQMQNGLSGMDRPVVLEAILAIMARPEWRLGPSGIAPLSRRRSKDLLRNVSTDSLATDDSSSTTGSVYDDTRSTFVQNLGYQMNVVIDKMSLRHAPASLVAFCGTATAYAFFFCPGITEALLQIWKISADTIKRVAEEFGLPRRVGMSAKHDDIVSAFPHNIHVLGWSSPRALVNHLRKPVSLPKGSAVFPEHGLWVNRWCGRDSEFFYDFCKHYHILLEDFIPSNTPFIEKARAPAFVLVHAQIVSVIDGTLHKMDAADDLAANQGVTFEDILARADASVTALPLSPFGNMARPMSENRLIILARDVLDRPTEYEEAQRTFAEAFACSLKTAAKRTSLYNHSACFLLCDFLEELWPVYANYHKLNTFEQDFIDWQFWLEAWQKMLDSRNNLTVIRLFSFIYTIWDLLRDVESRLEAVCLEWLLSEETFERFFIHWCPMVRGYYMRLLAWRICRYEDDATQLEAQILTTVCERLKNVFAYYQYQKQVADRDGTAAPSSAPCNPATGRHLLIVRSDNVAPSPTLISFDEILANCSGRGSISNNRRHSQMLNPPKENAIPAAPAKDVHAVPKRSWSILGSRKAKETPRALSAENKLEAARRETASARSRSITAGQDGSNESLPETKEPLGYRTLSFKFSLEWQNNQFMSIVERRAFHSDHQLLLPRMPAPAFNYLIENVPGTAEDVVSVDPGTRQGKKYAGRALAEWQKLVREHDNFIERRLAEGVPHLKALEVPSLSVDGFRKAG